MAAGAGIGLLFPEFGQSLAVIGRVFLKLIQSVIAPVLFGSLVAGIARGSGIGRLGGQAVLLFEIATTIGLLLGWGIVWLTEPGVGVALQVEPVKAAVPVGLGQVLESIFPTSIFDAMAKGSVLQIVIFCVTVVCDDAGPVWGGGLDGGDRGGGRVRGDQGFELFCAGGVGGAGDFRGGDCAGAMVGEGATVGVCAGGAGAFFDCAGDDVERGGVTEGDGGDGAVRSSAAGGEFGAAAGAELQLVR